MTDSATLNEAVDLLECSGWKGYAKAVREQSELIARLQAQLDGWHYTDATVLRKQRDELLAALKGVVRVCDRDTREFDVASAVIAQADEK